MAKIIQTKKGKILIIKLPDTIKFTELDLKIIKTIKIEDDKALFSFIKGFNISDNDLIVQKLMSLLTTETLLYLYESKTFQLSTLLKSNTHLSKTNIKNIIDTLLVKLYIRQYNTKYNPTNELRRIIDRIIPEELDKRKDKIKTIVE